MRIALYVHCFYPDHFYGTEAYTLALAKQMLALGHRPVVLACTFVGEPAQTKFVEEYEWQGVPVIRLDKNLFPNTSIRSTYWQPEMRHVHERLLRRVNPDFVLVCHLINHTAALLEVTAAMHIPTFATFTDFFGFCLNNKLEAADGSLCSGPDATRANCVACHLKAAGVQAPRRWWDRSDADRGRIKLARSLVAAKGSEANAKYGFAPKDIVDRPATLARAMGTLRGAIAPSLFLKRAYEQNGFAAPLQLSHFGIEIDRVAKPPRQANERLKIAYIGQIARHKGVHVLIDAMRTAACDALALSIWGPETQDRDYATQLKQMSSGLQVSFQGTFPPEQTAAILADIDVLVIPSTWHENSPLILLQALATHTPVIVSDVLGLTEFIVEEQTGFSFPRGNSKALAAILARFAEQPGMAVAMSAEIGYPRTTQDMARDMLEFVEGILAESR